MTDSDSLPNPRPIADILRSLIAEDDQNALTVMASAVNLYAYSISLHRTGSGRNWTADDVGRFLNICTMLLAVGEVENQITQLTGRPRKVEG